MSDPNTEDRIDIEWLATGRDADGQRAEAEADLSRLAAGEGEYTTQTLDAATHEAFHGLLRNAIESEGVQSSAALIEEDGELIAGAFPPARIAETMKASCTDLHTGFLVDATQPVIRVLRMHDWPAGAPDYLSQAEVLQQFTVCGSDLSTDDLAQILRNLALGDPPARALGREAIVPGDDGDPGTVG